MADGVGKSILSGATTGAKLGGMAGSAVPGVGNVAGAVIGGTAGAIGAGVTANKNKKKDPNSNMPGLEDPTQTARMLEIDRIAKNIGSGSDAATQSNIAQNNQNLASTQNRLSRSSGGNSSALTDALLKAQKASGMANNQAFAQGQQRLPFYQNLGQQLSSRGSQRALELQLLDRGQQSAELAQGKQTQNVNRNAALASGLPDLKDGLSRIQALKNLEMFNKDGAGDGASSITPTNQSGNISDALNSSANSNPLGDEGAGNYFKGAGGDSLNDISQLTSSF